MEDYDSANQKLCQNCLKKFPQQKIDLHEAYCRRNIKKCSICFQMYDINDQQGHDKQFHSKKECRHCGISFLQKQLDIHQPNCRKRPVSCKYCENDIAYEQILKHQDGCGSRTSQCEICKKYIALKQIDIHKVTCVQRISPIRNQPRNLSRDELRQNIRDPPPTYLARMRSNQQRRVEQYVPRENYRDQIPSYQDPVLRRHDRVSNQRINVLSSQKQKVSGRDKPKINFQMNIKPSHIIEPERIRQAIDPVPISIRLAMGKSNKKMPLQNRN